MDIPNNHIAGDLPDENQFYEEEENMGGETSTLSNRESEVSIEVNALKDANADLETAITELESRLNNIVHKRDKKEQGALTAERPTRSELAEVMAQERERVQHSKMRIRELIDSLEN